MNKILCIVTAIIAISIYSLGTLLIPNFITILKDTVAELPLITKCVFLTYRYWWLMVLPPVILFCTTLVKPDTNRSKGIYKLLITLNVFMVLLAPITLYAIYSPIFKLAGNDI